MIEPGQLATRAAANKAARHALRRVKKEVVFMRSLLWILYCKPKACVILRPDARSNSSLGASSTPSNCPCRFFH
ncbi:MAG: hypothetical protein RL163_2294 [Pseudomonadota bacterium]